MVMALTANSKGSWPDSSCSRSMTTEVSMTPRWARWASGTGAGVLGGDAVEVSAKPRQVDARSALEHSYGGVGIHEPVAPKRSQLPDGYAMSGDDEGLTPVQPPHDFATVVPELTLRDVSSHDSKCSTTCYTMVIRLAAQSNSLSRPRGRPTIVGKWFVLCPLRSTRTFLFRALFRALWFVDRRFLLVRRVRHVRDRNRFVAQGCARTLFLRTRADGGIGAAGRRASGRSVLHTGILGGMPHLQIAPSKWDTRRCQTLWMNVASSLAI